MLPQPLFKCPHCNEPVHGHIWFDGYVGDFRPSPLEKGVAWCENCWRLYLHGLEGKLRVRPMKGYVFKGALPYDYVPLWHRPVRRQGTLESRTLTIGEYIKVTQKLQNLPGAQTMMLNVHASLFYIEEFGLKVSRNPFAMTRFLGAEVVTFKTFAAMLKVWSYCMSGTDQFRAAVALLGKTLPHKGVTGARSMLTGVATLQPWAYSRTQYYRFRKPFFTRFLVANRADEWAHKVMQRMRRAQNPDDPLSWMDCEAAGPKLACVPAWVQQARMHRMTTPFTVVPAPPDCVLDALPPIDPYAANVAGAAAKAAAQAARLARYTSLGIGDYLSGLNWRPKEEPHEATDGPKLPCGMYRFRVEFTPHRSMPMCIYAREYEARWGAEG